MRNWKYSKKCETVKYYFNLNDVIFTVLCAVVLLNIKNVKPYPKRKLRLAGVCVCVCARARMFTLITVNNT